MATDRRGARDTRERYAHFDPITTRWLDNDAYGHVNNVVYYAWFDSVVNRWLIERGLLDIHAGPVIGLVVETHCQYFASATFPDTIHAGLRVARIGSSSVRYEVGLFRGADHEAAAQGYFVHVYVDRQSRRPVPLPQRLREALQALVMPDEALALRAGPIASESRPQPPAAAANT